MRLWCAMVEASCGMKREGETENLLVYCGRIWSKAGKVGEETKANRWYRDRMNAYVRVFTIEMVIVRQVWPYSCVFLKNQEHESASA